MPYKAWWGISLAVWVWKISKGPWKMGCLRLENFSSSFSELISLLWSQSGLEIFCLSFWLSLKVLEVCQLVLTGPFPFLQGKPCFFFFFNLPWLIQIPGLSLPVHVIWTAIHKIYNKGLPNPGPSNLERYPISELDMRCHSERTCLKWKDLLQRAGIFYSFRLYPHSAALHH